jgi:hypothetical protein
MRTFSHPLPSVPGQAPPLERNFSEPLFPSSGWLPPVRNKISISLIPPKWFVSSPNQVCGFDRSTQDHSDPMDVDTSYNTNPQEISISVKDWDANSPTSATPTVTKFDALFYDAQSPPRSATTTSPPVPEFIGKRRSHSPESVTRSRIERLSSPPPSSPSIRKLERIVSAGVSSRNPSRVSIVSVSPPASVQDGQSSLQLDPSTLSPKSNLHTQP